MPALKWAVVLLALVSCKHRITQAQCDEMLDHYATLVVRAELPDAPPDVIDRERARERSEARGDDSFKNCTAEIEPRDYECAMRAETPDALEKCLE